MGISKPKAFVFLSGLGLSLVLAGASAHATPSSNPATQAFKKTILRNLHTVSCDTALAPVPRRELTEVRGAPGFLVVRSLIPFPMGLKAFRYYAKGHQSEVNFGMHELESTLAYGAHVSARYGERVLFLPSLERMSVPGFDGVILDAQGEPIANYTLKTLTGAELFEEFDTRFEEAITRGQEFSTLERWADFVAERGGPNWGNPDPDTFDRQFQLLGENTQILREAMQLFGIPSQGVSDRPLHVFLDVVHSDTLPLPWQLDLLRDEVAQSGFRGRITIRKKDGTIIEIEGPTSPEPTRRSSQPIRRRPSRVEG